MNLLQDKYQDLLDIGREWKLSVVQRTVDEWIEVAEGLMGKHGGVLPRLKWLKENGYGGLIPMLYKYPERFDHIKWEKIFKTVEERIVEAEKLAKQHHGVLPSQKWLKENGHNQLYRMIQNHPERFSHIKQEKLFKTIEEHIADADKLAREHDGVLPCCYWLRKYGYGGLADVIRNHPERFAHIKQEKFCKTRIRNGIKTIEEHIADAEKLAIKHDGFLPRRKWLTENGYSRLANAIHRYPERFSHIRRIMILHNKSLDERLVEAEELVKQHGGTLPSGKWLKENGHSRLYKVIQKYPKSFSHIEKDKRTKTIEEHIVTAEKLRKQNGGVLPSVSWLRGNGYYGLYRAMLSRPEKFAHIKQEKLRKIIEEHIADAEKLAEKLAGGHDRILPNWKWLKENGHNQLYRIIHKYPERFAHIKQESFSGKVIEEHIVDAEKMARKHNGVLPTYTWLMGNGYSRLANAIRKHSGLFARIKQEKLQKTIEEHVAEAEELAREHNGALPIRAWLEKNGHRDLVGAIRRCPERFAHIKRMTHSKALRIAC